MPFVADFHIKKGDLRPTLRITVKDGNGDAINLTGATVTFRMRAKTAAAGVYKVNAAATLVDAVNGVVEYIWAGSDTDTAGLYYAEFRVVLLGNQQTTPNDRHLEVQVHDVV